MPHLAIIGGGPLCTYALERLAALLPSEVVSRRLKISIFEASGRFGAGATHSETQARTSYLNRVASQIAFAADESNRYCPVLLPPSVRPTFCEWAQEKYRRTSDERFNVAPREIPLRYLHGEALREFFYRYVGMLVAAGVDVDLHAEEVADVSSEGTRFRVHIGQSWSAPADQILFVTGHSNNEVAPGSLAEALADHARKTSPGAYIPHPYPLADNITKELVPPGCSVAVVGLGLTAIDVLLHLTEGRGGTFVAHGEQEFSPSMRYVPSGDEPSVIAAVSPSGMFPSCRPNNDKAADGSALSHAAHEHQACFFTIDAIQKIRRAVGLPNIVGAAAVRQLDFELHVFPLLVLEMAYVYYTTLLGSSFGRTIAAAVDARYRAFLQEGCESRDAGTDYLLEPVQQCFDSFAASIGHSLRLDDACTTLSGTFDTNEAISRFQFVVYGGADDHRSSPWGHSPDVSDHRFDWRRLFFPLTAQIDGPDWQDRLVSYMRGDHVAARQGNLLNPTKAACDGVWRDLRAAIGEAIDFGGLTAASQRKFVDVYFRLYSRMSNGIGLEAMRKVLGLIEAGLIDVSFGPNPAVEPVEGCRPFRIRSTGTRASRDVDVVIEGRSHAFNADLDVRPLYRNLMRRGLVRRWRNPGQSGSEDFVSTAVDVTADFHPVHADGSVDPRLTLLGAPSEGVAFFQLSAARPWSSSSVLNRVARWANEFVDIALSDAGCSDEHKSESR